MRVNGSPPPVQPSGVMPKAPQPQVRTGFHVDLNEPEVAGRAAGVRASANMGSLIAAQIEAVADEQRDERRRRRRKGVDYGLGLLDLLDKMKIGLLGGQLDPVMVLGLIAGVERRDRNTGDAALETLLDEIELRARVELAKLKRSS